MQMMRAALALVVCMSALGASAQQPDSTETIARNLAMLRKAPYPRAAIDAGIEGTVLVEFTIDRLCSIKNKRVVSGLGYGLDEAALQVIDRKFEDALTRALMPCSPDTIILPITFRIK